MLMYADMQVFADFKYSCYHLQVTAAMADVTLCAQQQKMSRSKRR
jgi:hypothetical protein